MKETASHQISSRCFPIFRLCQMN